MQDDIVSIAAGGLSAEIACLGAELQRLTHAGHGELLWDGDAAFWTGRAPVLFPIVGALKNDRYRYGGREYALPKHGFARRKRWTPVRTDAACATFRLEDDQETRLAYPFAFRLELEFALDEAGLALIATLANRGDVPMPASFGFHPALRWPLPYGADRAAHIVRFDAAEPAPIRRIDAAGLLRPDPLPTPVEGRDLRLRDDLFVDDALIFDRLQSRGLLYGAPGHAGLRVEFTDMPELGIWTKPGAGYVCIEPWHGHADPEGFAGDIFEKPGIVRVAPGEQRRFAMRIALATAID
ncbi:MAG: aldose 1-epimerase family protein [Sphingomonadaceae bacterium]|nr:aldose 1-epimerase family protein [Sphingomonadaceae bacterium]